MPRKALLRIIVALALSLLGLGLYSGLDQDTTSRLYENARLMADKAKQSVGFNSNKFDDDWDELINLSPLIAKLKSGDTSFEWSSWLDLDKTRLYDSGDLDPKLYPYLTSLSYKEEPLMPYEKTTSPQEQAMIGRLYCKTKLTSPFRIVPLNSSLLNSNRQPTNDEDNGEHQGPTVADANILTSPESLRVAPLSQFEVKHSNPSLRHHQFGHSDPTVYYNASEPLVPDLKAPADSVEPQDIIFPRVSEDMFTWLPDKIVGDLDESVQNHGLTLYRAAEEVGNSDKYFHEVWMRDDPTGYGVHHDWRFFRGILPHEEHVATLHALARAWQQFAELMGITYWYAHGSLLGHLWNGMTMPWDSDHDIQMPIMELDRLARDFNRTLVLQDLAEGHRKYLIDVNPYYIQRIRGNKKNVIDARFVDVDTGLYIDITGLARLNPGRKMVSCKNQHSYRVEDFGRLRRSMFEGYPALIPLDIQKNLAREYKNFAKPNYNKWQFNYKVQLWEYKESCDDYLAQYKSSNHVYCYPSDIGKDDGCMDEYDTCDKVTINEFHTTRDVTNKHIEEFSMFEDISPISADMDWSEFHDSIRGLIDLLGKYKAPYHKSTSLVVDSFNTSEALD